MSVTARVSFNMGERAKGRFDQWLRDYPRATPIGVFLFALLLVGISAWSVEMTGARTRRADAAITAGEIAAALGRQTASSSAYLQATSALLTSSRDISPGYFSEFAQRLRLNDGLSGVVGLGWSESIDARDAPALTQRMIASGRADFRIYPEPAPNAGKLDVITMLAPATPPNLAAIGFNMRSEARRAEAIERALRTHMMAASHPVELVQDAGARRTPSFLVYVPVYTMGNSSRLKGFVYAPIRIRDFILAAVNPRLLTVGRVEIYDRNGNNRELIFQSGGTDTPSATPIEQPLAIFDQQWVLRYHPPAVRSPMPLTIVVLVGGISFALLLLAYILLVQRRNGDLQALVDAQAEREADRAAFVRELNHRVKNTLSNVTSIIALTRRNATSLESFTDSLLERVRALAASHSLLDGAQWGPTDLKALIEAQLSGHDKSGQRIGIDGPNVLISPNDALTVGLALHELVTNATRYGALSTDEGRISVRWTIEGQGRIIVDWVESNGPAVTPPEKRGFGLNLIERALAQELGQPITIDFDPAGLRCRFVIALRMPREFRLRN